MPTMLQQQVEALMRAAASEVVLPRFNQLRAGDIRTKSPGEIVTCVDLEVERRLSAGLEVLLPNARVIGEELAAKDPALLHQAGKGLVWLVDPLDGTANYAAGGEHFGIMVALVEDGMPQMGWIFAPLEDRMCFARRGQGAWCDNTRIFSRAPDRDRPRAALGTHFLSSAVRQLVHSRTEPHFDRVAVPMCAAESYWRLLLGQDDIMLFQRSLPWDHAAGALLVNEAGGCISHWDRTSYRVGGLATGILAARNTALWENAANVLLDMNSGLVPALGYAA